VKSGSEGRKGEAEKPSKSEETDGAIELGGWFASAMSSAMKKRRQTRRSRFSNSSAKTAVDKSDRVTETTTTDGFKPSEATAVFAASITEASPASSLGSAGLARRKQWRQNFAFEAPICPEFSGGRIIS